MRNFLSTLLVLCFVACQSQKVQPIEGATVYGEIKDEKGKGIEGVVVSDGFTCVATNKNGVYQMAHSPEARFVYYSTPSGYNVNVENDSVAYPMFYARLHNSSSTPLKYDFTLKQLKEEEKRFTLLCLGDIQPSSVKDVERFRDETMNDIKTLLPALGKPVYAMSMGDVTGEKPELYQSVKKHMGSAGFPMFTTIGNHDKFSENKSIRNANTFMEAFGPVNFSYNRGDVHFVFMDDILFSSEKGSEYKGGFTDEQVTWLKQDLSFVSKDKMVILIVHIPIRDAKNMQNRENILSLLKGFKEVHIMAGHTHYGQNFEHTSLNIYEHIHGGACGAFWRSNINGDGTPNGYAVYEIDGATITNWYYKPTNYDKSFQMRLHYGDTKFGGEYGSFDYGKSAKTLIANIWNADSKWEIEVYEDGVKTGDMLKMKVDKDAWARGYHIGVLNRNVNNYSPANHHLYEYQLKPATKRVEVKATDRFGTVYTQDQIIATLDSASKYE